MFRYIDRLYGVCVYIYMIQSILDGGDGMGWEGMWDGQYINYIGEEGSWNVIKLYLDWDVYVCIHFYINKLDERTFCINKPWFSPKNHGCLPETHGFFHVFPQPWGASHGIQDSTLMTEEIFGPVLPVLTVSSCDEAISIVNGKEMPDWKVEGIFRGNHAGFVGKMIYDII